MSGAIPTCRRCSTVLARPDAWYCNECRKPNDHRASYATPYVDPWTSSGHTRPTETDMARVLEYAERLGVPVYSPDRHGNLTRRTKEN